MPLGPPPCPNEALRPSASSPGPTRDAMPRRARTAMPTAVLRAPTPIAFARLNVFFCTAMPTSAHGPHCTCAAVNREKRRVSVKIALQMLFAGAHLPSLQANQMPMNFPSTPCAPTLRWSKSDHVTQHKLRLHLTSDAPDRSAISLSLSRSPLHGSRWTGV